MKKLMVFCGLLAALAAAAVEQKGANTALVPVPKLENDNYDWYARHERILKEARALDPEIVLIGDSITHHWAGLQSIGDQNDPKTTEHFKKAFAGWRVLDLGFGWDRIQNMLWRIEHGELDGLKPKRVILLAGTNNMSKTAQARDNTAEEIAEGVLALVKAVRRRLPKAKVTVMGILPRAGKTDRMRLTAAQANARLRQAAAQSGYEFLDLSEKFVDASGERLGPLYRDGVHLSPAGYAIWADALRLPARKAAR